MGIITNMGYKGFTYVQSSSPPSDSEGGDTWLNHSDIDAYIRDNNSWVKILELFSEGSGGAGDIGIFGGGYNPTNIIDYKLSHSINANVIKINHKRFSYMHQHLDSNQKK
jgi:hypothetical protein